MKNDPLRKYDLFGVQVSGVDMAQTLSFVVENATRRTSICIDHMPVHGLMTASNNSEFNDHISSFDIVAPDGHPVRYALNRFYGLRLYDRVYGPDFMLAVCKQAVQHSISVFLYGSTISTLELLEQKLFRLFPELNICGKHSPPFRDLNESEDEEITRKINDSNAGIVFIGLGCPKQEVFAASHKGKINAVMICVGAAFDFHAGTQKQAPRWMQKNSLEWLFRLLNEPYRLGKRYVKTNSEFILQWGRKELSNFFRLK